jgi:hypothetical protein
MPVMIRKNKKRRLPLFSERKPPQSVRGGVLGAGPAWRASGGDACP